MSEIVFMSVGAQGVKTEAKVEVKGARTEAVEKVQRAIDLLEEAAEGFTRENGGHPSEFNGVTTAELTLRKVIGK
jgi:hypothetical protein